MGLRYYKFRYRSMAKHQMYHASSLDTLRSSVALERSPKPGREDVVGFSPVESFLEVPPVTLPFPRLDLGRNQITT